MSELTPDQTDKRVDYAYIDKTKDYGTAAPVVGTEASHAELNPAFYPKSTKPEALWTKAEKNDADSPEDPASPEAPASTTEEVPESATTEAVQEREAKVEEMGKKDIEAGTPVASPDPEKARSAEEGKQAVEGNESQDDGGGEGEQTNKRRVSRRK